MYHNWKAEHFHWYAAFILKIRNRKRIKRYKKQINPNLRMFTNTQYCWLHYITHPCSQLIFIIQTSLFKYKKVTCGTSKFFIFIYRYSSENFENLQSILCSWVRASWINVNNCPTRCDYMQFYYISVNSLHVSDDTLTHHQEHT